MAADPRRHDHDGGMMRRLMLWLTVLALLLGGLWLGAESLLMREIRRYAAQDPGLQIAALRGMRQPGRIGTVGSGVEWATPAGRVELPQADLWLSPLRPTELRLDLPPGATFDDGYGAQIQSLAATEARLRLRPLAGAELASFALHSGPLTLGNEPLAQGISRATPVTTWWTQTTLK